MNRWTNEDVELLKLSFPTKTKLELISLFPDRTYIAIWKKAHRLGLIASNNIKWENRSIAKQRPRVDLIKNRKGYNLLYIPNHPRADRNGRVFEHIVVWEEYYNEDVSEEYVIHHINGIKDDNRVENLQKMKFGEHTTYHNKLRKRRI